MLNNASGRNQVWIVRLTADDRAELRGVRLRALRESPTMFGASYETESALDDAAWQEKAQAWTDAPRSATWVARQGTSTCGLTACFIDAAQADRAWLASVWVDPAARRRGVAGRLLEHAGVWAEHQGAAELRLHVTSNNPAARRLYENSGFVATGDSMPHPRVRELVEWEMCRRLDVS